MQALHIAHDDAMYGGHRGIKKTKDKLRDVYWPGMSTDVDNYIRTCDTCQKYKNPKTLPYGLLQPIPSSEIGQRLQIDIIGPMTRSTNGNMYILTGIDAFSRFGYARAVPRMRSEDVERFINEEVVAKHGAPKAIASDNGKQLVSKLILDYMKKHNIKALHTCPYWLQANGMDERFNGTLVKILRCYVSANQLDWDNHLIWALYSYNTTVNESTKYSPYILMYGSQPRHPLKNPTDINPEEIAPVLMETRNWVRRNAEFNIQAAQKIYKHYYDQKHRPQDFKIGDLVLQRVHAVPPQICKKLAHRWSGPYVIVKFIIKNDQEKALLLGDLADFSIKRSSFGDVKHYHLSPQKGDEEVEEDLVRLYTRLHGEAAPLPAPHEPIPNPDQVVPVNEGRVRGGQPTKAVSFAFDGQADDNRCLTSTGDGPIGFISDQSPVDITNDNANHTCETRRYSDLDVIPIMPNYGNINNAYDNRWYAQPETASIRPPNDSIESGAADISYTQISNDCEQPADELYINQSHSHTNITQSGSSTFPQGDRSLVSANINTNMSSPRAAGDLTANTSSIENTTVHAGSTTLAPERSSESVVSDTRPITDPCQLLQHDPTLNQAETDNSEPSLDLNESSAQRHSGVSDENDINVIADSQERRSYHGSSPPIAHSPEASSTPRYNLRRQADIRLPRRYIDKQF